MAIVWISYGCTTTVLRAGKRCVVVLSWLWVVRVALGCGGWALLSYKDIVGQGVSLERVVVVMGWCIRHYFVRSV